MATRISFKASVSFEHPTAPVRTHRTEIVATTAQKAASQAIAGARRTFPGARYTSVVVVLEEVSRTTVKGDRPGPLRPSLRDIAILGGEPSL